jgi:hypothetical protein
MYRKVACGSFVLMRADELPGAPEVEASKLDLEMFGNTFTHVSNCITAM